MYLSLQKGAVHEDTKTSAKRPDLKAISKASENSMGLPSVEFCYKSVMLFFFMII